MALKDYKLNFEQKMTSFAFRIRYYLIIGFILVFGLFLAAIFFRFAYYVIGAVLVVLLITVPFIIWSYRDLQFRDEMIFTRNAGDEIKFYMYYIYVPTGVIGLLVSLGFYYYSANSDYLLIAGIILLYIVVAFCSAFFYRNVGAIVGVDYV
ncbi:hypothetical protein ACFL9U_17630 [Thermodesulfobacteriota bacterium]